MNCRILDLILLARPDREIARQLGIEEGTVQARVRKVMGKTGQTTELHSS